MLFDKKVELRIGQPYRTLWTTLSAPSESGQIVPDICILTFNLSGMFFTYNYVQQRQFVSTPWIHLSPFEPCDGDWVSQGICSRFSYGDRQRRRPWLSSQICRSQSRPIISVFWLYNATFHQSPLSLDPVSHAAYFPEQIPWYFFQIVWSNWAAWHYSPWYAPWPRNPLPCKYNWSAHSFLSNLYPCWYDWV